MAKTAKTNVFAKAKANPTRASSATPEPQKVTTEGLELYAFADALEKQAKALKSSLRAPIEAQMYKQFLANRGENYKGVERNAKVPTIETTATLMCNKRSSTSGLSDVEVTLCEKKGISLTRIEGDFKLNVAGVSEEKLQEVSDAISKIKGLPENFIEFDASKARTITTDTSIAECFRLNDPEDIAEMLKVVASLMIKPKTTANMATIVETLTDYLVEDQSEG